MKWITYILIISTLISCNDERAYKTHVSGFEYKIILQNSKAQKIKINDVLDVNLKYTNQKDSVIFNSEKNIGKFRVKVEDANTGGLFQTALMLLHEGDSASFIISAKDFYRKTQKKEFPIFLNENELLKFKIRIKKIISKKEMKKEYEKSIIKMELEENFLLQEYLKTENIKTKATKSGLYLINLKKGKGIKSKKGQKATIHYKASFINGKIISSSINKGKPYSFTIGNNEVIKAWDQAILTMRVGDKLKIIAPSHLAYGEFGYEPKIPPFTTLIFEIKLLKLN